MQCFKTPPFLSLRTILTTTLESFMIITAKNLSTLLRIRNFKNLEISTTPWTSPNSWCTAKISNYSSWKKPSLPNTYSSSSKHNKIKSTVFSMKALLKLYITVSKLHSMEKISSKLMAINILDYLIYKILHKLCASLESVCL